MKKAKICDEINFKPTTKAIIEEEAELKRMYSSEFECL
jgi:hypothetical protein